MKILEHSTLLRKQYPASVKQRAAPGLTHLILSLSLSPCLVVSIRLSTF